MICECGNPVRPGTRRKFCDRCRKAKSAEAVKIRRRRGQVLIRAHKNRPCMDCGGSFPHYVMDLDHRDPAIKPRTANRTNRSLALLSEDRLRKVLAGCDVVCANCHRTRTKDEGHYLIKQEPNLQPRTSPDPRRMDRMKGRGREASRLILSLKEGKPCMDCGGSFPPEAMDFDHREGKRMSVSAMVRMKPTEATVLREISKCDLVCANCHRIRTWEEERGS